MSNNQAQSVSRTIFLWLMISAFYSETLIAQPFVAEVIYQVEGIDFSNGSNGPSPPTSTSVIGVYAFSIQIDKALHLGLQPDYVEGMDFVRTDGVLMDFNEANSSADIEINTFTDLVRIHLGGNENGASAMVGLSEDFRVIFDVSLIDFELLQTVDQIRWGSPVDSWEAGSTFITLIDFQLRELPIFADNFEGL